MADNVYGWQLAAAEVERQFGPPKSEAQKLFLEKKLEEAWINDKCIGVACRAYKHAFGFERFPDIDVLVDLGLFYGRLADDSYDTIKASWDVWGDEVGFNHSLTEADNLDLVSDVVNHTAITATYAYAERIAKGGIAVEKMKKFGRALLGTASAIAGS